MWSYYARIFRRSQAATRSRPGRLREWVNQGLFPTLWGLRLGTWRKFGRDHSSSGKSQRARPRSEGAGSCCSRPDGVGQVRELLLRLISRVGDSAFGREPFETLSESIGGALTEKIYPQQGEDDKQQEASVD